MAKRGKVSISDLFPRSSKNRFPHKQFQVLGVYFIKLFRLRFSRLWSHPLDITGSSQYGLESLRNRFTPRQAVVSP